MKSKISLAIIIIVTGFILSSCNKDDDPVANPQISNFELGTDNSKTGYIGTDLHVEAEILAEGTINNVELEIHQENNTGSWEFDSLYTEFSGLKNTNFHKHIDIPEDADTGSYHFHFIVTDMEGNQSETEEELYITVPADEIAPEIVISSAPVDGETFADGETIVISGTVSDNQKIGGLYIGLVRDNQNLSDSEVNATNTITILHTHDFESSSLHSFSANITVGSAQDNNITPKDISGDIAWQSANYYIVVKCKDAFGGNWTFSEHYPLVINY